MVELAQGHKFGMIALPEARSGVGAPLTVLGGGYAVSSSLPEGALDTWHEDLGNFHHDELTGTSLFLWRTMESQQPELLDGENQRIEEDVHRFYLGLMMAMPYFSHGRVTRASGGNIDGRARMRSLTTFGRSYHTLGAPGCRLTVPGLRRAAQLAEALMRHDERPGHERIDRAIRAFRVAREAYELDFRLHQFVRCIECFVSPSPGQGKKVFAERLSLLCAGHAKHALEQLYAIRGTIEHLRGPYPAMPPSMSRRRRFITLLQRCVQAEAMASYLLMTYLRSPECWGRFDTSKTVQDFWGATARIRNGLWPSRLELRAVLNGFDMEAVAVADPWA